MPDFNLLGTLMRDLHQEFVRIYYLMLPVFFALSIVVTWVRSPTGSIEFLDVLRRTVVSTVLLVAFPEISSAILFVADGIADRINGINSIDALIRMAQEKSETYSASPASLLLQFNDLIIACLSFLSYLVLYIARYLTIAMYHFFWIFFMVTAPLLLLFNLFPSTGQVTANLFKGMIEVACWKIVWAILGAMLSALSFGDAYRAEGNYLTLIVMNFVIAIAMLATPLLVRSLIGSGAQSMSSMVGQAATAAMIAAPTRAFMATKIGASTMGKENKFAKTQVNRFKPNTPRKQ